MARTPKPWYWTARKGWYATLDGQRHLLAVGRSNERAAKEALRRMLADKDAGRLVVRVGGPTLGELLAAYLADLQERVVGGELSAYRKADVMRRLAGLDEAYGDRRATDLKPSEIKAWLATHPEWGPTMRADAVGEVRTLFRWAVRERRIKENPVEGLRAPQRRERRAEVLDPDLWPEVLAEIRSPCFRDLAMFCWLTGARVKEARTLRAEHIDWARAVVIRTDHKTYARTRKARVIPLPWVVYWIVRRLAVEHPEVELFRNEGGRAWTKDAVNCQIRRLRTRLGLEGAGLVASAFRHGFATRFLEHTGDLALGAAVLGHSSTAMLSRVYGHLERRFDYMRRVVDDLNGRS